MLLCYGPMYNVLKQATSSHTPESWTRQEKRFKTEISLRTFVVHWEKVCPPCLFGGFDRGLNTIGGSNIDLCRRLFSRLISTVLRATHALIVMTRFVIRMLRKHILVDRCPSFVSCRNKRIAYLSCISFKQWQMTKLRRDSWLLDLLYCRLVGASV